jgi:hypothetical protein
MHDRTPGRGFFRTACGNLRASAAVGSWRLEHVDGFPQRLARRSTAVAARRRVCRLHPSWRGLAREVCTKGRLIMFRSIMGTVPVFYATTEGQTRLVAEQIASTLRQQGLVSEACEISTAMPPVDWLNVAGVVLGASIYAGRHQKTAVEFARNEARHLSARPSAFFSVSLSAGSRIQPRWTRPAHWRAVSSRRRTATRAGSPALPGSLPTAATDSFSVR